MKNIITIVLSLLLTGLLTAQSFQHLDFDGIDDHVRYDNASELLAAEYSMTGWFYTEALNYGQGMMGLRDDAGGDGGFYMIQLDNGKIECRMQNDNGTLYEILLPSGTVKPQTWQHYAFTYGSGKIKMYLDGNLLSQKSAFGNIEDATKPFVIGRSICCGLNFYMGGKIDEVSLWSKELSETEVKEILANEIDPEAASLELYYKFDQGIPGDNNQSITKLKSETGDGERDGDIIGFALQGTGSNFGGEIDESSQVITFEIVPNKLTTDMPFDIAPSSSAGLPVTVSVVSGPATLAGNTITLTGEEGTVVLAANQAGDNTFDPATEILVSFDVIDPANNLVAIDARSPYTAAVVFAPALDAIRLAVFADIAYPELFDVADIAISISGDQVTVKNEGNGYYTGWWTPPAFGDYEMLITGTNNYDARAVETIPFTVAEDPLSNTATAVENMWLDFVNQVGETEVELPCYTRAYERINARLDLVCPSSGGCGEWDRIVNIEAQDETGRWIEIIRYITPYGKACDHSVDLTDFASILHGKTKFRITNGTFDNGYIFNLYLDYNAGTPPAPYSKVIELWDGIYPFGDLSNLQPTETLTATLPDNISSAKMKLVSTGHGWGDNNTSNAAEFFRATHTIAVDGQRKFTQDNWENCNPNPDGCSPQFGTWQFNRAGWCPGAIAPWFDFDLNEYKDQADITFNYIFNENYADFCHPNNVNCVTNASCNCEDGFNPVLHVASSLVLFSDSPIGDLDLLSAHKELPIVEHPVIFYPNPSSGLVNVQYQAEIEIQRLSVINSIGQKLITYNDETAQRIKTLDLSAYGKGLFNVLLESKAGISMHQLVIE